MKLNKLALVLGLGVAGASGSALAAGDQGQGRINFKGTIIDAPCSISPTSSDQSVDLGQISTAALRNGGKSEPVSFGIQLTNCDPSNLTNKTVTTSFSGTASQALPGYLAITGTASGASIAITSSNGEVLPLGTASAPTTLVLGSDSTANFAAFLQGNGPSATIGAGSFSSVANFTLTYQ